MLRRDFVAVGLGATLAGLTARLGEIWPAAGSEQAELEAIERRVGGRLGVAVLDTASGRRLQSREHERFPMCSTFKWLLVAHVLSRVDASREDLTRLVAYGDRDLLDYAPVTRARVGDGGMPIADLCDAVIRRSDNTAANLLLATVGGPPGLTAYLRSIGDEVTRLDRTEPELNSAVPGDLRDTTTPSAMLSDMQSVLLGDRLTATSRERLVGWLVGSTTGGAKLRAGLPPGWRVGDKTGMGANGATNDVAIVWPVDRPPVLVAAYLTETAAALADRNAALAEVGRVTAAWIARPA
jgi:beta-lactamase class A